MEKLSNLPNIGKELENQLLNVGVTSSLELERIGAKEAWLRIQKIDPTACLHRLYALEGAIRRIKKPLLPDDIKKDLKDFYNANKK